MNANNEEINSPTVVYLCRRYNTDGREFHLEAQPVFWSGDTIDVCSVCNMNTYDHDWEKHHSKRIVEI